MAYSILEPYYNVLVLDCRKGPVTSHMSCHARKTLTTRLGRSWSPTDVFSVVFDFVWVCDPEDYVLELLGRENDAAAVTSGGVRTRSECWMWS